jgi:hypothetical protein
MNVGSRVYRLFNEVILETCQQPRLKNEHRNTKHHSEHCNEGLPLFAEEVDPRNAQ